MANSNVSLGKYEGATVADHLTISTITSFPGSPSTTSSADPSPDRNRKALAQDDCHRGRCKEEDVSRLPNMPQQAMGQTVTPFLKQHIPDLYAPVGKPDLPTSVGVSSKKKDSNSKFCYRHRPDSKCRRAADERKMNIIQSELEKLPPSDRQAITTVWSLFSGAPSKQRELMLQGILAQCCFPQLSIVSKELSEQLKIDFLSALPVELSFKILQHLDCASLCKAAQVSRRWRLLADDDSVWHHMCEQHIDRKCTQCGWGLPRLDKKRLMDWRRQRREQQDTSDDYIKNVGRIMEMPADGEVRPSAQSAKRRAPSSEDGYGRKRQRTEESRSSEVVVKQPRERKFRPWKDVYRDRFRIGCNWRYGRCNIKTFRGEHSNGVTCLQFSDSMLATGSYDATVKLWDIDTGRLTKTLSGHTQGIRTLQFDQRVLVSGSLDSTVKIWDWRKGTLLQTLNHHDGIITVHMDGNLIASGSMDTTIKVFNFRTQESYCLRGHADWVNQVRIDSGSRTLLSASDDCTVKLWDLDTSTVIKTYEGHVGQVQQVLPLPDDYEFDEVDVKGGDGSSVTSNHIGSPAQEPTPPPGSSTEDRPRSAYGQAFVADRERHLPPRYMLTGSLDATMRLWDTATGKSLRTFFGHVDGIWGLAGDSLRYVTAANDATVKVWDAKSGKCERTFTGHEGPVTCVGLSDSRMASGGEDGEVRFYRFDSDPSETEEMGMPS